MDKIDAILYINLDHRTDRREHLESEFQRLCIPTDKIHRVSAIKNANGALGCTLSHIKCLRLVEEHPEWQRVMIMEDDFTFKCTSFEEFDGPVQDFFERFDGEGWDIFLPSYNHWNAKGTPVKDTSFYKVIYSQTTSSYVFQRHYLNDLKENFRASAAGLIQHGKVGQFCLDINWTKLQPTGRWYLVSPSLGFQYDNFSDIESREVRYGC